MEFKTLDTHGKHGAGSGGVVVNIGSSVVVAVTAEMKWTTTNALVCNCRDSTFHFFFNTSLHYVSYYAKVLHEIMLTSSPYLHSRNSEQVSCRFYFPI